MEFLENNGMNSVKIINVTLLAGGVFASIITAGLMDL
jgi:hypothetical protein